MLTMTTCVRWILPVLLVTGSAICGILAAPNSTESAKPALDNGWPYPPGDKELVPGVEPLHAGAVSSSDSSWKEDIPTTTIQGDVVAKRPSVSPSESKKLSTTGKIKHDGKRGKELSSIETILPTPSTRSSNDGKSPEISAKSGPGNRTDPLETVGARSLGGNDVVAMVDEQTDTKNSLHGNITDLSDVSMDYDYRDVENGGDQYLASAGNVSGMTNVTGSPSSVTTTPVTGKGCTYGNETFLPGMKVTRDCEDQCVCGDDGKLANCEPLCVTPFVRSGRGVQDSLCREKLLPDRPCCAILICAQDSEPEPEESCYIGNKTVARGDTVEEGCTKVCVCEAQGMLKCRPRCPPSNATSTSMAVASSANQRDKCVPLPDPRDPCCTITLCDVTLGDLDQFKPDQLPAGDREPSLNLTKVVAVNSTAIKLTFSNGLMPEQDHPVVEISTDHRLWREHKLNKDGIIGNLEPSRTYYVRVVDGAGHRPGTSMQVVLPGESPGSVSVGVNGTDSSSSQSEDEDQDGAELCHHRGKSYKVGAEWYDECISFCTCSLQVGNAPKTECSTIECPTDFGLDVLDPNCLDWEWVPADFVPKPPHCCSQEVRCRNNGSCLYEGKSYINWSEIPSNVTGCEKRCYCELGNVSCHSACPPVTALPPPNLQCPPSHASLKHLPEDECCLHWVCADPSTASFPTNTGRNGTAPAYPGPLATDRINQLLQSVDDKKISAGKSGSGNMQQRTDVQGLTDHYGTVPRPKYHESSDLESSNHPDLTTDEHQTIHYPMDPGYPTTTTTTTTTTTAVPIPPPYQGPYSPDFRPTQPSVEDVFRLTPRTHPKTDVFQEPKDRQKSKTESKKPIEPAKPVKVDTSATIPGITTNEKTNFSDLVPTMNENEMVQRYPPAAPAAPSYQKNYSSSLTHPPENGYKVFPPHDGGGQSPGEHFQFYDQFAGPVIPGPVRYGGRPPAAGHQGPNTISPGDHQSNNIGTRDPGVTLNRGQDSNPAFRPPLQQLPNHQVYFGNPRPNLGPVSGRPPQQHPPGEEEYSSDHDIPEELYHLINLQHPGLIRLNEDPPEGHQGLYAVQVHPPGQGSNDHETPVGQVNGLHHQGSLQYYDPQVFSNPGGGGAGGYQVVHRDPAGLPPGGARQQIEELLLRVGEKDPNAGPFQRYPTAGLQVPTAAGGKQTPIIGPPRVIIPQVPQNSERLTRLNHPFAGTAMIHDMHSLPGADHRLPPGFPGRGGPQGVQSSPDQVTVQTLEAIAENRVRLVFTVPHVLVGLHGRVEVRYTSEESNVDPGTWKSQVFAPPDDLIATPQLEFELGDLRSSTEYKVMVTVKLRDLSNSPTSKIYKVTTLEAPINDVVTLPPQIPTDAELIVAEANSTWANIVWKKFTEYELQFIDGVQLRYKETEGKVYAATPLIHRAVTSYVIENLKPSTTYEVGIYFIPFPGQATELVSENPINFTTSAEPDPYSFDIKVEIKGVKSTEVEVAWRGVPYPEDKYVNIYRAIYQSDTGKEDTSTFKIAKRDSPARTMIGDLKPGTRYRLWIEVYLTNGRIKKSNVQDFVTKPGVPSAGGVLQQGKLASQVPVHEGDYYGPLVIVAIVASLAILSTLILLMMLMKRRTSSKADISPRKTTAAYDNPSYKTCEGLPTTTATASRCNGEKIIESTCETAAVGRNQDQDHRKEPV